MKTFLKILMAVLVPVILVFSLYFNNTGLVDTRTSTLYSKLKDTLRKRGYTDRMLVISTKRFSWHNNIQVSLSGAASKSRHLTGEAIDFLVFDINNDGNSDAGDVDIVYRILDGELLKGTGGIGTYKNEHLFIDRQMVHIDCRKKKGRWQR